jgi:hypothetical protein
MGTFASGMGSSGWLLLFREKVAQEGYFEGTL